MKTQTVGILTVFAYLATCLVSRPAQARVCSVPSDCPKGWDCAMVDAGTASDGVPAGTCFSLPCQSNSDCGPGLSCFIWGWSLALSANVRETDARSKFSVEGEQAKRCS